MNQEAFETYQQYLNRQAISKNTRRSYLQRVSKYLEWLAAIPEGERALIDPVERDFQTREFKQFLLQRGASPSTANGTLSALDNFYLSRGMKRGKVKRLDLPRLAPRAFEPEEERRLLKALGRWEIRNRAIVLTLWHTGLRISELASLNFGDLTLTARTGHLVVRCGKGMKSRMLPINSDLRECLLEYTQKLGFRAESEPLFMSQKKSRLSISSIDRIVRRLGQSVGMEISAHDLRHNFVTRLIRGGSDLVLVAELAGHAKLETIRRYSLPTQQDKENALEKLCHAS